MSKIKQLSQQTINEIAAGEVVERPASVVKELVENALDAAADRIDIAVKHGGISELIVQDNGSGIEADELELALVKHATSKLKVIEDLHTLQSMGFRGEALAAIAAVSKLTLISKPAEQEHAYMVEQHAGAKVGARKIGANNGTQVIVRELFYNVPARLKFLKKEVSETQAIVRIVTELALANPQVAFTLTSNEKLLLQTPGNNDLISVIHALFGAELADNLLVVEPDYNYTVQVSGYVGKATLAKKSRRYEFFFVNGRTFQSTVVLKALEDALRDFLMTHQFPTAFLYLTLPANLVDVNVHPRKLEVRFWNDNEVYRAVYHQVKAAAFNFLQKHRQVLNSDKYESVAERELVQEGQMAPEQRLSEVPQIAEAAAISFAGGLKMPQAATEPGGKDAACSKADFSKSERERQVLRKQVQVVKVKSDFDEDYLKHFKSAKLQNLRTLPSPATDAEAAVPASDGESTTGQDERISVNFAEEAEVYDFSPDVESDSVAAGTFKQDAVAGAGDIYEQALLEEQAVSYKEENTVQSAVPLRNAVELLAGDGKESLATCNWDASILKKIKNALYLGQIMATYLLFAADDVLLLLDQHALHERILYEKLCRRYGLQEIAGGENCEQTVGKASGTAARDAAGASSEAEAFAHECRDELAEKSEHDMQSGNADSAARELLNLPLYEKLLVPYEFQLEPAQALLLKENLHEAEILGYKVTALDGNRFALAEIPKQRKSYSLARLTEELLSTLGSEDGSDNNEAVENAKLKKFLASRACRSAIMAGDYVAETIVPLLIDDLLHCVNPYQCPHGRPVCLYLGKNSLEKAFRRRL